MSREERTREKVMTYVDVVDDSIVTCDRCGGTWTQEEIEQETEQAPVQITLGWAGRASAAFDLDYCPACADIVWQVLCQVVGRDDE